jgi:hypothetical protein
MEEQSPLDLDPISSVVGTPAGDRNVYEAPEIFRRLSHELGPTPIVV